MSFRLKRLYADYKRVSQLFMEHPYIVVKSAIDKPPEKYQIEYKIKGLEQKGKDIMEKEIHLVEIVLTRNYPVQPPQCRMLTPVFHPNIDPYTICITDHWVASESLADLIVRIGEMICYQSYNIKSPRNGEAARWADENISRLPIDTLDLSLKKRPEEIVVQKTEVERLEIWLSKKQKQDEDAKIDTAVKPIEPHLIESKKVKSFEFCSNCGAKGKDIRFQECINGHFVCFDCILECQNCGKNICVLCSFNKCVICERVLCDECQVTCPLCNQIICKDHCVKCASCHLEGCPKCISETSYFNVNENLCRVCASKIRTQVKITHDDITSRKVDEILAKQTLYVKRHLKLGLAYRKKGMIDEAISEYTKALKINPDYAMTHNNIAMAYYHKKEFGLAIKHCDSAIELGFRVHPNLIKALKPHR